MIWVQPQRLDHATHCECLLAEVVLGLLRERFDFRIAVLHHAEVAFPELVAQLGAVHGVPFQLSRLRFWPGPGIQVPVQVTSSSKESARFTTFMFELML